MKRVRVFMFALLAGLAAGPALAQAGAAPPMSADGAEARDWQDVISGQIAAFRVGDGARALSFASTPFRQGFTDPAQFLVAIDAWGYGALMSSRSESFGAFTLVAPDEVVQAVTVVGNDMVVYQVVYDLLREDEGWRVKGVQMAKTAAMGA